MLGWYVCRTLGIFRPDTGHPSCDDWVSVFERAVCLAQTVKLWSVLVWSLRVLGCFVRGVSVAGQLVRRVGYLRHEELARRGTVLFEMSEQGGLR